MLARLDYTRKVRQNLLVFCESYRLQSPGIPLQRELLVRTHTDTYIHTYIYTHIHTYTHTQRKVTDMFVCVCE